jgi:RND family efflux transporter MFP subunit
MNEETKPKVTEETQPPPLPQKGRLTAFVRGHLRWVVLAGAAAVVVLLAIFLPQRNSDEKPHQPSPTNVRVLVVQPTASVVDSILLYGVVEPDRVVELSAEVAARVETIVVREGDDVKQGQLLLRLNTDLLSARTELARANRDFDKREYERLLKLFEQQVATQTELDRVKTASAISKSAYAEAQANLERAHILAAISGRLNRLPVEVGEFVQPGMVVAEIVDMDTAVVALDAPEKDVKYLRVGDKTENIFRDTQNHPADESGDSQLSLAGRIRYISDLADPAAHTTRVEVAVHNRPGPDGRRPLHDGQIVRVGLKRQELKNVIEIPLEAVIPLEKGYVVYVNVDGKAERRKIDLDASLLKGRTVGVRPPTEKQLRDAEQRRETGENVDKLGLEAGDRLILDARVKIGPRQAIHEVEVEDSASGGDDAD